jgi:2-polyprenyl-6-methoxyphenol hydroxylase-like FAD-dependent oxidoreductase
MAGPETSGGANAAVVGAGPAGMMTALLLARAGVRVALLEAHRDFERDFRGDMIHPSTLEVLDQLGVADRLHELPHAKMRALRFVSAGREHRMADFSRLPTKFPYVMVMPQARFLEFLAEEARRHAGFSLHLGASVRELLVRDGVVGGVVCDGPDFGGTVEAALTIGADGRFSRVRRLAGLAATSQSLPMEVLWFRVPRAPTDPRDDVALHFTPGAVVVALGRDHDWQVGCVVPPGTFAARKGEGVRWLRSLTAPTGGWLSDRCAAFADLSAVNVLRIEADRVVSWHRPGLLLIGDAAHAMLPVGGVGLNCAVADAVEAANVLARPLRDGAVDPSDLAAVQRRRSGLTAAIQRFQRLQPRVLARALASSAPTPLPAPLRLVLRTPLLRSVPARIIGFGVRRVRVESL